MASITSKGPRLTMLPPDVGSIPIPYADKQEIGGRYESCLLCSREIQRPTMFVKLNRDCTRIIDPAHDPKGAKYPVGPECLARCPDLRPFLCA